MLENMLPHLFAGRMENLLWILDALKDRHIGICVDTGHAYLGCNLSKIVEISHPYLRLVHASDNHGHWDDHLPPGDGKIDWLAFLSQLLDARYEGTFILEIAGLDDRRAALQGACRGRDHLRRLAATLEQHQS